MQGTIRVVFQLRKNLKQGGILGSNRHSVHERIHACIHAQKIKSCLVQDQEKEKKSHLSN